MIMACALSEKLNSELALCLSKIKFHVVSNHSYTLYFTLGKESVNENDRSLYGQSRKYMKERLQCR